MFSTDPEDRADLITGLRQLADYLDTHADVPVPPYGVSVLVHADSADHGGKDQVNAIADALGGIPVHDEIPDGGHYYAIRAFGTVSYEAIAICDAFTARADALRSYRDCVIPDTETVDG
jgi:hypothetical protein